MYKPTNVSEELLPIVNENDEVIGSEKRGVIHAKKLLHRAVHVLVFNSQGNVYVQKRALCKDTAPGKWDSSSSGHVDPGETYEESAVRELKEELNIDTVLSMKAVGKLPASPQTGMEFTAIYVVTTEQEPIPNSHEIMDGKWMSVEALDSWIDEEPEVFAGCFRKVWRYFSEKKPRVRSV